jgi:hypothetical protein
MGTRRLSGPPNHYDRTTSRNWTEYATPDGEFEIFTGRPCDAQPSGWAKSLCSALHGSACVSFANRFIRQLPHLANVSQHVEDTDLSCSCLFGSPLRDPQ